MSAPTLWTDSELGDLVRDYDDDRNGHDDVIALLQGARRVVALHKPVRLEPEDEPWCSHCSDDRSEWPLMAYPCATVLALALEETP